MVAISESSGRFSRPEIALAAMRDTPGPPPAPHARATDLLLDAVRTWPHERITVGDLLRALGDRGLGLLMLVLALPCVVPLPFLGISSLLGTPVAILAGHLIIGRHEPWLPGFVRRRGLATADLARMLEAAKLRLAKWEARLQPGTLALPDRGVEIAAGLNLLVNAIMLALPIPWGNPAPASAIALLSIALVEADRRLYRIAMAWGVVAILIDLVLGLALLGAALAAIGFVAGQV
jgi:hypothetical protein